MAGLKDEIFAVKGGFPPHYLLCPAFRPAYAKKQVKEKTDNRHENKRGCPAKSGTRVSLCKKRAAGKIQGNQMN
jgi:hypothetical protein